MHTCIRLYLPCVAGGMTGTTLRVVQVDAGLVLDAIKLLVEVEVVDAKPALLAEVKLVLVDEIPAEDGGPLLLGGSRQILLQI